MTRAKETINARVTKLVTVYFEKAGSDPLIVETRMQTNPSTDEEAYSAYMELTDQWVELPKGWISNPSMLIIQPRLPVQTIVPPREVQEQQKEMVVEIAYAPPTSADKFRTAHDPPKPPIIPMFEVAMGDTQPLGPKNLSILRIRVSTGKCKCRITLLP